MLKVLLIRPSYSEHLAYRNALSSLSIKLYDVYSLSFIQIDSFSTTGDRNIYFLGVKIETFDKIIFLGTPIPEEASTITKSFIYNEFNASLIAFFKSYNYLLFNRGLFPSFYPFEMNLPLLLLDLTSLGWETTTFEYKCSGSEPIESTYPLISKQTKCWLFVTPTDYLVASGPSNLTLSNNQMFSLIKNTQGKIAQLKIDYICLEFSVGDHSPCLTAISPSLPISFISKALLRLIFKSLI